MMSDNATHQRAATIIANGNTGTVSADAMVVGIVGGTVCRVYMCWRKIFPSVEMMRQSKPLRMDWDRLTTIIYKSATSFQTSRQ